MKTLIIGIDGATFSIISPLIEEGELPNIESIMDEGVSGELESTNPPVTIPAWPAFLTGKNPGKTGVFGMHQLRENSYRDPPYHSGMLNGEFWESLEGKGSVFINVPGTYPAKDSDNATIVAGPMTPEKGSKGFVNDERVREEYSREIEEYILETSSIQKPDNEELLRKVSKMAEKRFQLIESMVKKEDWDLFVGHFLATDRLQHQAYGRKDLLKQLYRQIDGYIGELKDLVGDDVNIVLMSDHGFGRTEREFHTGSWLREKGYTELKSGGGMSAIGIKDTLRRMGVYKLLKYLPNSLFKWGAETVQKATNTNTEIDWENTTAFTHDPSGEIYINLEEKRPNGQVSRENYRKVRDEIEEELKDLEYNGEMLNVEVCRPEEIYHGSQIDKAPDLVFKIEDHAYQKKPRTGNRVFRNREPDIGWHRDEGIFMASGPDIKESEVEGAEILDLAPTILHMLRLEVPSDMDGRVIEEGLLDNRKIDYRENLDI